MLVSIVIPTYNRKEFTQEAINSVLSQTFQDFEIIVVRENDGKSGNIKENQGGVKYYDRPHRGPAAARNFGVSVTKGKYIAFLDSDDIWHKNKLEKQIKALQENSDCRICYTNGVWLRNGEWVNQKKRHQKQSGYIFERALELCIISCSTVVMEKAFFDELGGFDESFPVCEDYEFWLRVTAKVPVLYLEEKLFTRRAGHPDQLSQKYWGMDRFRIRALEKLLASDINQEQRKLVLKELAQKYNVFLTGSWKRRRYFRWLRYKLKSIITLK